MTLKGQIERIERTIGKIKPPKTKEQMRHDVIEAYGLPEDIPEKHLEAFLLFLFGGVYIDDQTGRAIPPKIDDRAMLANPDYPRIDNQILFALRRAALRDGHLKDFTDEELIARYQECLAIATTEHREIAK